MYNLFESCHPDCMKDVKKKAFYRIYRYLSLLFCFILYNKFHINNILFTPNFATWQIVYFDRIFLPRNQFFNGPIKAPAISIFFNLSFFNLECLYTSFITFDSFSQPMYAIISTSVKPMLYNSVQQ